MMNELRPPRHPLCPYCEYNLTGVFDLVERRFVRCPECGEDLEPEDIRWSRRPGDWTLWTALQRTAMFLAKRSALIAAILIGNVLLVEGLGMLLNRASSGFVFRGATVLVIQTGVGLLVGKVLAHGMEDGAGFTSWILPVLATLSLIIVAAAIAILLPQLIVLRFAPADAMLLYACVVAAVLIVFEYVRELA